MGYLITYNHVCYTLRFIIASLSKEKRRIKSVGKRRMRFNACNMPLSIHNSPIHYLYMLYNLCSEKLHCDAFDF